MERIIKNGQNYSYNLLTGFNCKTLHFFDRKLKLYSLNH
jgi:hypothetical protein